MNLNDTIDTIDIIDLLTLSSNLQYNFPDSLLWSILAPLTAYHVRMTFA